MIITDHFTRYAQAFPIRSMSVKTAADAFSNHFVKHYRLPKRIKGQIFGQIINQGGTSSHTHLEI